MTVGKRPVSGQGKAIAILLLRSRLPALDIALFLLERKIAPLNKVEAMEELESATGGYVQASRNFSQISLLYITDVVYVAIHLPPKWKVGIIAIAAKTRSSSLWYYDMKPSQIAPVIFVVYTNISLECRTGGIAPSSGAF